MIASSTEEGRGSAGGKVILIGEHAVVHGARALVVGLQGGVTAVARRADHSARLQVDCWQYRADADRSSDGDRALRQMLDVLGLGTAKLFIEADAVIPSRAGLGASAAMAVAVARAVSALFERPLGEDLLQAAVDASERIFHASPSGIDSAAVRRSGLMIYSRADGVRPLDLAPPPILVVYSGAQGATRDTVREVSKVLSNSPEESAVRIARIDELTALAVDAISQRDFSALGRLMNENQEHLQWFGVSTDRLDDICRVALKNGALGVKLTGGGGGGCAVVLAPDNETQVAQALSDSGYQVVIRHV